MPVYLYLAGYCDTGLCSCEKYDVQHAIWKEIKPMGKARSKFCATCTQNGQIMVLGGKLMVIIILKIIL